MVVPVTSPSTANSIGRCLARPLRWNVQAATAELERHGRARVHRPAVQAAGAADDGRARPRGAAIPELPGPETAVFGC